jgi:hypothetical protein
LGDSWGPRRFGESPKVPPRRCSGTSLRSDLAPLCADLGPLRPPLALRDSGTSGRLGAALRTPSGSTLGTRALLTYPSGLTVRYRCTRTPPTLRARGTPWPLSWPLTCGNAARRWQRWRGRRSRWLRTQSLGPELLHAQASQLRDNARFTTHPAPERATATPQTGGVPGGPPALSLLPPRTKSRVSGYRSVRRCLCVA